MLFAAYGHHFFGVEASCILAFSDNTPEFVPSFIILSHIIYYNWSSVKVIINAVAKNPCRLGKIVRFR